MKTSSYLATDVLSVKLAVSVASSSVSSGILSLFSFRGVLTCGKDDLSAMLPLSVESPSQSSVFLTLFSFRGELPDPLTGVFTATSAGLEVAIDDLFVAGLAVEVLWARGILFVATALGVTVLRLSLMLDKTALSTLGTLVLETLMRRETPLSTGLLDSSASPEVTESRSDLELLVLPLVDSTGRVGGLLIVLPLSGLGAVDEREEDRVGPVADLPIPLVRPDVKLVFGDGLSLSRADRARSDTGVEVGRAFLSMMMACHALIVCRARESPALTRVRCFNEC